MADDYAEDDEEYRYSDIEDDAPAVEEQTGAGDGELDPAGGCGVGGGSGVGIGSPAAHGGAARNLPPAHPSSSSSSGRGGAAVAASLAATVDLLGRDAASVRRPRHSSGSGRNSFSSSGGIAYRRLAAEEIEGARAAVVEEVCAVLDAHKEAVHLMLSHFR